jgi:hypothetical protein
MTAMPQDRVIDIPVQLAMLDQIDMAPRKGACRIVRMIPTPMGEGPAIWTSPYTITDPDVGDGREPCRRCAVLIAKGPPRPEIVLITIPAALLPKCREGVVEW